MFRIRMCFDLAILSTCWVDRCAVLPFEKHNNLSAA